MSMSQEVQLSHHEDGLTAEECNEITERNHKGDVEFDLTESKAMYATIGDRLSVGHFGEPYIKPQKRRPVGPKTNEVLVLWMAVAESNYGHADLQWNTTYNPYYNQ